MKKTVYVMMAIMLVFSAIAIGCGKEAPQNNTAQPGAGQEQEQGQTSTVSGIVPFYTPGTAGSNYILGAGITQLFNSKKVMPQVNLVTEATGGTEDGLRQITERYAQGKPAFGALGADMIDKIYNGEVEQLGAHPELRAVSWIGSIALHVVVPADSSIQSLNDLKGKRVGFQPPGSAANSLISTLLADGYGLTADDYKTIPLPQPEIVEAVQNKSIDVGIITGTVPAPALQELGNTMDIRVIPVEEAVLSKFISKHPYYSSVNVPAGTYPKQDQDLLISTFESNIVTHEKTDEELVYNLIKLMMENVEELTTVHPSAANLTPENILKGFQIPLHPGAERYYKEVGIIK